MFIRRVPLIILSLALLVIGAAVGIGLYPLLAPRVESGIANSPITGGGGEATTDQGTPAVDPIDMALFRQVQKLLERDFLGDIPDATVQQYGAIRGLVESYADPYTFFVEPQPRELERDNLRGSFGGIGAYIVRSEEGFILEPIRDQPAEVAGLLKGDRLLRVDEVPIDPEMAEDDVITLVRGEVGTEVLIDVLRIDGPEGPTELAFSITRAIIETPTVTWNVVDGSSVDANVGYIRHTLFSERSADEMRQAITELVQQGAERFVLDLRGNPGGLVDAAIAIAHIWLEEGVIYREERADGTEQSWSIDPDNRNTVEGADLPLIVVVDEASASASEIIAGALQDHGRALLVGRQTFGKGSVQFIHELGDASSLHVTTAQWFTPEGHAINGLGLTPDIVVEEGEDPLPVAIEQLQEAD